jgi:chloramphenicol-sensitive protein RarD
MNPISKSNFRLGLACALGAQVLWGCFPIYVYLVRSVESNEFVAHRTIWSFLTLIAVFTIAKFVSHPSLPKPEELGKKWSDKKSVGMSALAAILIAINWIAFVWAVTHDYPLDASLGYYICPQVVVLLGVILLGERLSWLKWVAIGIAAVGVTYMALKTPKGMPWISIAIAFSFGFYALVKKQTKSSALCGLTFETGFLFLPAIAYLGWKLYSAQTNPFDMPIWVGLMLLGSGVATIAPLALYATAVKHIPLSTVGFFQFVGPTLQFFVGIFFIGQKLDPTRLIGFAIVWIGVVIFLVAMRRDHLRANLADGG